MSNPLKKGNPFIPLIALVIFLIVGSVYVNKDRFGAMTPTQNAHYSLVASSTLTNAFTGAGAVSTTGRLFRGFDSMVLAGTYLPNTTGSRVLILLERSIDEGVTYQPFQYSAAGVGSIFVETSATGSVIGTPIAIPQSVASTSGTSMTFSLDLNNTKADFYRFSAKEVSSSTGAILVTPGVLTLKAMFTTK
ncbi:MAG: hypothetical protein WC763_05195 [Candidatus Paceibacterota bacterium]|jgi:hypothetical protein